MKGFLHSIIKKIIHLGEDLICILKTIKYGKRSLPGRVDNTTIFIMGNGPSLNEVDLNRVKRKGKIVCVNWFPIQSSDFFKIKPEFYCIIDPVFFDNDKDGFSEKIRQLYTILMQVDWDMTIITMQGFMLSINNKNLHYEYISRGSLTFTGGRFRNYLYRNNLASTGLQNVVNAALYFFLMKNYKEIYVSGIDMDEFKSYTVDKLNHVISELSHFYGNEIIDFTEKGSIPLGTFYIWLGYYSTMLYQFAYTASFAKIQQAKVINCSLNSFVDVFEKKDWKDIF